MARIKRLVLEVLKPHHPNALEFSRTLAGQSGDYKVKITVSKTAKKTETIVLVIEGLDIHYDVIIEAIKEMGAIVHSINEVEVEGTTGAV